MKNLILVIDDEPDMVDYLSLVLKSDGYDVITAGGGIAGLQQARRYQPDLIILDIMMPDLDGYDVCRNLADDPCTADINVILLSAMGNVEATDGSRFTKAVDEQLAGYDVGAVEFLSKPISKKLLLKRVEFMLWLDDKIDEGSERKEEEGEETAVAAAEHTPVDTYHYPQPAPYRNHRSSLQRLHHAVAQDRPTRVLIIDDDPTLLRVAELMLRARGYEVHITGNGFSGLEHAKVLKPDLIILDVQMPIMSGYEVCRRLRADPETADIYVLMLTNQDNNQPGPGAYGESIKNRAKGIKAGADDFLNKPIVVKELLAFIDKLTRTEVNTGFLK